MTKARSAKSEGKSRTISLFPAREKVENFPVFPRRENLEKYRLFPEGRKSLYISYMFSFLSLTVKGERKEGESSRPPSSLPLSLTKGIFPAKDGWMKLEKCKTRDKRLASAKGMPPMARRSQDGGYCASDDEAVRWISKQPDLQLYLFDLLARIGYIAYDRASGMWKGSDYHD